MKKWRFNSLLSKKHGCGLSKSTDSLSPIENTRKREDSSVNDREKKSQSWRNSYPFSYSNVDKLFRVTDILNLNSDDTFLVIDSKGDSYSIYFDIENKIFEIYNEHDFYTFWDSDFLNSRSKSDDTYNNHYTYDTKYNWNNHINNSIDNYLYSQIRVGSSILSGSDNYIDNSILSYILSEGRNIRTITNDRNLTKRENLDVTQKKRDLWVQCDNCYFLNFKKLFTNIHLNICEQCGYHLKMSSSDRIELLIDPGTWNPMDEDMVSVDPLEFHSEEEPYKDRINSYQRQTGLTEAVQTGIGQLYGIPVAIGVMDFEFMGGSMGSVVGEKITRLIEYASNKLLPLIIVCASGGARMQEGSLSLMQMAKIASVLYDYQSNKRLFYVSILTSPTTGGVTASFGMLGDIIIAEPNAYIAFAGKRVIEQTLNKTVPEGSQAAEYLFHKGLFDPIVPRNLLKGVLSELFQLHAFFPVKKINKVEN
uniref:Acetyl-coenzyme A carboxylase carboxyl transferase subunit beta, chloroplastic n=2 Tax=Silene vulgaris TaxID=42043 RepID=A0A646QY62_SILVU|nr:acetyl-CoA carboxylase carboxyltransferase beta subunit [Silene vulgaris]AEC04256.1 acetyl-CoA carboxylase carboxyltransferase beta subunit [Silene vulgaris]QBX88183.1 acetyl-CoA carboxylase carboxyltransferase beta subunit [Silene vulgaris subsp. vulgaris]QBX88264.1 acetyl-CoA carboxylase carboxyltransferase beta subunit [Silene vulgaris subsp. vulgaris]QGR23904.1 acetyl-CoA carboxylase carboxyltransferase beta subunit [Silene vulgaris subsp. vulgaris]